MTGVTLYFLIKKVPEWLLNLVITSFFTFVGTVAAQGYFEQLLQTFAPASFLSIFEPTILVIKVKWNLLATLPLLGDRNMVSNILILWYRTRKYASDITVMISVRNCCVPVSSLIMNASTS